MQEGKVLTMDMLSEYCTASKAFFEIIPEFPPLLDYGRNPRLNENCLPCDNSPPPHLPILAPPHDKNPLPQHYVFYSNNTPIIDCFEEAVEPRHTATIPYVFLNNYASALQRSLCAWRKRHTLERMRQGRFNNLAEAHENGWHRLEVSVKSARLIPSTSNPITPPSSSSSENVNTLYVHAFPFDNNFLDLPLVGQPENQTQIPIPISYSPISNLTERHYGRTSTTLGFLMKGTPRPVRTYNDLAPSSFIEISIEDSEQIFIDPIGRTNTEYYNHLPIYGTNLHLPLGKKSGANATNFDNRVELTYSDKECILAVFEHANRNFFPTRWKRSFKTDEQLVSKSFSYDFEDGTPYYNSIHARHSVFKKYVSNCVASKLRVDLHLVSGSTSKRAGTCLIPLNENGSFRGWVTLSPLKGETAQSLDDQSTEESTSPEDSQFESMEVFIEINLNSPIEPKFIAPDSMRETYHLQRNIRGEPGGDPNSQDIDYRSVIADCYEWMWMLGFTGQDPLICETGECKLPEQILNTKNLKEITNTSPTTPSSAENNQEEPLDTTNKEIVSALKNAQDSDNESENVSDENAERSSTLSNQSITNTIIESNYIHNLEISENAITIRSRTDFWYSIDWIEKHIKDIQEMLIEIFDILIPSLESMINSNYTFRSSVLKKEHEVQPLPVNLHYQLLAIRPHVTSNALKSSLGYELINSITCGSLSPHMLGHKQGGLFHKEQILVSKKEEIVSIKSSLDNDIKYAGGKCLRPLDKHSKIFSQISKAGELTLKFEKLCLEICRRRMFSLSQAISVAVNAFLLKLKLLINGHINVREFDNWSKFGFLIVFEGLLSVINNERSMLEDTISAVDSLKNFQFRLVSLDNPYYKHFNPSEDNYKQSNTTNNYSSYKGSETFLYNYKDPLSLSQDENSNILFKMIGREIIIFLPSLVNNKQSKLEDFVGEKFHSQIMSKDGYIVTPIGVLFTQGIDIQQSMVSTFGGDSNRFMTSVELQHHVNLKALCIINQYTIHSKPLEGDSNIQPSSNFSISDYDKSVPSFVPLSLSNIDSNNIHPLVRDLYHSIKNSSLNMKNIDLLREVERLCLALEGVRITFCKSGKDRTGMAVTLEQARQLSERFHTDLNETRILKESNLMRVFGSRILVAEKNIGKKVYSINTIQCKFLPLLFRPPLQVCEDLMKKDNS